MAFQIENVTTVTTISTANTNLDGSGLISPMFSAAGTYGSVLGSVRIQSTGAVSSGMIRLFLQAPGGGAWSLIKEIPVSVSPGSSPPFSVFATTLFANISLANGWTVGASTQIANGFLITALGYDITGFI